MVAGLLLSSPVWIWQIWAFVLPALHRNEKRWAMLLTATGAPLFIGGAALAYLVLPKAIERPDRLRARRGRQPASTGADYFDFIVRMMLVFGVAAEIPLVVIMLNRLGIVSARQLATARPWTIIGIFVFAAVATPSTDPLTMLFLAVPDDGPVPDLGDHRAAHRPAPGQGPAGRAVRRRGRPARGLTSPTTSGALRVCGPEVAA